MSNKFLRHIHVYTYLSGIALLAHHLLMNQIIFNLWCDQRESLEHKSKFQGLSYLEQLPKSLPINYYEIERKILKGLLIDFKYHYNFRLPVPIHWMFFPIIS
jgi:hypothetical protein